MAVRLDSTRMTDVEAYRRLRTEHVMYRMLEEHNRRALADPTAVDLPGRGTVSLSRMQWLRDAAVNRVCAAHGQPATPTGETRVLDRDRTGEFVQALRDICTEQGDLDGSTLDGPEGFVREFNLAMGRLTPDRAGTPATESSSHGFIVTPTDPLWRQRWAMSLARGHEAMVTSGQVPDALSNGEPTHIANLGGADPAMWSVPLSGWSPELGQTDLGPSAQDVYDIVSGPVPSYSWVDACGLTALRPYAESDTAFANLVEAAAPEWEQTFAEQGITGTDVTNMRRAVHQEAAILDKLIMEGHTVDLAAGDMAGTVEANIDGNDVVTRVFDRPGEARYVGRSYSDGATWRLDDVRVPRDSGSERANAAYRRDLATLERGVSQDTRESLVRLALGERPDAMPDGMVASYTKSAPVSRFGHMGGDVGTVMCQWTAESRFVGYDVDNPMAYVMSTLQLARDNLTELADVSSVGPDMDSTGDALVDRLREHLADEQRKDPRADLSKSLDEWLDRNVGTIEGAHDGTLDVRIVSRYADGNGPSTVARRVNDALRREDALARQGVPGHSRVASISDTLGASGFDDRSARRLGDAEVGPFQTRAMEAVADTLSSRGMTDAQVAIDNRGVIRWTADKQVNGTPVSVTGLVGQVFEPDATGEVHCDMRTAARTPTEKASGKQSRLDFYLEPSYSASIIPTRLVADKPTQSVYERMRVHNDLDDVISSVRRSVAHDLYALNGGEATGDGRFYEHVGTPTSVNLAWRTAMGERHATPSSEVQALPGRHIDRTFDETRRLTERNRVHMDPDTHRHSSSYDIIQRVEAPDRDVMGLVNDLWTPPDLKALSLTGLTDMSSMSSPQSEGIFDTAITAQGMEQGTNKTLVSHAGIASDGSLVPSDVDGDKAPIMYDPIFAESDHDTWLRQQLAASNVMSALEVTEPVQVAHMAFGGFEQDDAIVVSKAFADRYSVTPDGADKSRPLSVNDKLSDVHGNKGLVSLIVDPAMSDEEADAKGIRAQRDLFRANPNLSCVMSPFSFVSRGNAGTAREGMASPHDLNVPQPDGTVQVVPGGSCDLHMVVQSHTVDEKSTIYDDEGSTRGRLVGWQLTGALAAMGANNALAEMFEGDEAGLARMRESCRIMGYDIDAKGHITDHLVSDDRPDVTLPKQDRVSEAYISPSDGQVRFAPAIVNKHGKRTHSSVMFTKAQEDVIAREFPRAGGVAHIGMPLRFPNGDTMPMGDDGKRILPVLGAYDRAGSEFVNDALRSHDHTRAYVQILENDAKWQLCQEAIAQSHTPEPFIEKANELIVQSQKLYDGIANEVASRSFEAHDNTFKRNGLGRRVGHSATLPWSGDPRLDIQQLSIGRAEADRLNLKEGDPVVLWRDPVLTTSCVRSFETHISDDISGVQVNPTVAGTIGGDFDGDTIGLWVPQTEAAKEDCRNVLSFEANLLDRDHADSKGFAGLGTGSEVLDIKLAEAYDPNIATEFADLAYSANDPDYVATEGVDSVLGDLNMFVHEAQEASTCKGVIRYSSPEDNVRSIYEASVATGVKGSETKLVDEYCRNLGVEVTTADGHLTDPDGTWRDGCVRDLGHTGLTREQNQATQFATHAKAAYTGLSGYTMQIGLELARTPEEVRAATTLSEQIYQHTLDYKTNDRAAREETPAIAMLANTLRGIRYKMPITFEPDVHGGQRPVFDMAGGSKPMTPNEFAHQYREISKVFGITPNEHALDVVSHMDTLRNPSFSEDRLGGSAMHCLAFEPRRCMEHVETYAAHDVGIYDSTIARLLAPRSVKQANGWPVNKDVPTVTKELPQAARAKTQPQAHKVEHVVAQAAPAAQATSSGLDYTQRGDLADVPTVNMPVPQPQVQPQQQPIVHRGLDVDLSESRDDSGLDGPQ